MTDAEFIRSRKAEIDALFEEYVASFSDENAQGPHPWPNVGEEFCRAIDIAARYIAMWEDLKHELDLYLHHPHCAYYPVIDSGLRSCLGRMSRIERKHSNKTEG